MDKQAIRAEIRRRRAARRDTGSAGASSAVGGSVVHDTSAYDTAEQSGSLTSNLLRVAQGARCVSCYLPFRGEPDTRGFLAAAPDMKILLPVAKDGGELGWKEYAAAGSEGCERAAVEQPGKYGIPEPIGPELPAEVILTAEVLIIPAAAVDRRGFRLGWGKGYYDRLLTRVSCPVYAVVFEEEIFDELPADPWDQPVTGAITPKQILVF